MKTIEFTENPSYVSSYGLNSRAKFTPIYAIINGKEVFLRNLVNDENREIDELKQQLLENEGKFIRFYGFKPTPIEFIHWIKQSNMTFQIHGELFKR